MFNTKNKEEILVKEIQKFDKLAIAYSGGIDSSYLLKVALNTLGPENVLAVVVNSELFSDEEFDKAVDLANEMGAKVLGLEMSELSDERIVANNPESWYYSKKLLYRTIRSGVKKEGFDMIADGMIMDDNVDFRPGLRARDEEGIISLLQQAGLYKSEIRELAKAANISNWNKAASCSIASRIPYGSKLTPLSINQVFTSEKYLRSIGFPIVRVRVHQDLARIEVPENQLSSLLKKKTQVSSYLKEQGFNYVTFDLDGFKSGRMNDVLTEIEKKVIQQA
ncbi:ATP-dependent sacrificial sulfur transferase LarE [Enterococcus faecalis]